MYPVLLNVADTPLYQSVITALSTTLSEAELASVLAYGAGLAVTLVLLWWSARKVAKMLMGAFKRGKLRL